MNNRFNTITTFLTLLFTIMIAGFTGIMWYLIKEKKDIKIAVKKEIEEKLEIQLEKKADTKLVNNIMNILEKFALKNQDIAFVLQQHQVRVSS